MVKLRAVGDSPLKTLFVRNASGDYGIVDGVVSALDNDAGAARALPLPAQAAGTSLLDVEGGAALVRANDELRLVTPSGSTPLPVTSADNAKFVPGGILATAPEGEGHKLILLTRDGAVVAEHVDPEAQDARASILVHPFDKAAVVELAMGQDGCIVLEADLSGGLAVKHLDIPEDYVVAEFSTDGSRLLLGAHPNSAASIAIMDWPARKIIHTLQSESVLSAESNDDDEAAFDLSAGWVAPDCIVVGTTQFSLRVVVTDGQLGNATVHELPDFSPFPEADDAEIMWLYPIGSRRFVAHIWVDGEKMTRLYEIVE
jgi:hypothetical protein